MVKATTPGEITVWVGQETVETEEFVSSVFSLHLFRFKIMVCLAGSSWYLLCEQCREKYTKNCRGSKQSSSKAKTIVHRKPMSARPILSGGEQHITMKNNAMFLLDLASSADNGIGHQRR